MKKALLLFLTFSLIFTLSLPDSADAKRGGSYKSPKQSFTQTPKKADDNNVNRVQSQNNTKSTATTGTATTNCGFFSGGSLMKGLMIGGLAGLLFGSMFAGLGAFGDFLGLLVNLAAIYILFIAARGIYRYYKEQQNRKPDNNSPYHRP